MADLVRSSDEESDIEEVRGPGQPAFISGKQFVSLIAHVGRDWTDAGNKKKLKTKAITKGANYMMAKYGLLEPFRKLPVDELEPKKDVVCADDLSRISEEQQAALKKKLRLVSDARRFGRRRTSTNLGKAVNRTLVRWHNPTGQSSAAQTKSKSKGKAKAKVKDENRSDESETEETAKNEAAKTLTDILKALRVEKSKIFPHQVLANNFWQPEWTDELKARWEAERSRPRGADDKRPLLMNTRRQFLLDKLETLDGDLKAELEEKVEELQQAAQVDFDKTLNLSSRTPEECYNFLRDFKVFAERFVDIMAEGTKGVVLLMVASPTTENGIPEVEVNKYEWSSIPAHLGRNGLSYSEVDVDMFATVAERFRAFGKKVFDANFTNDDIEPEDAVEELLKWQTKLAAKKGHGIMDALGGSERERRRRHYGRTPAEARVGGESDERQQRGPRKASVTAGAFGGERVGDTPRRRRMTADDGGDGDDWDSEDDAEDLVGKRRMGNERESNKRSKTPAATAGALGGGKIGDTGQRRRKTAEAGGERNGGGSEDDSEDLSLGGKRTMFNERGSTKRRDRDGKFGDQDYGAEGVASNDGDSGLGVWDADSDTEDPRKGAKEVVPKRPRPRKKVINRVMSEEESEDPGAGMGRAGSGGKGTSPTNTDERTVTTSGKADVPEGTDIRPTSSTPGNASVQDAPNFEPIFAGWNPVMIAPIPTRKTTDVANMVLEEVKQLTYVVAAQGVYGTRGRVSNAGKFLQEVGLRCADWSVSKSIVYALLHAYLEFEGASPPAAARACEGWAELDMHGEEVTVRPRYLRAWAMSAQKLSWVGVCTGGDGAAGDGLDWNFGAAWSQQWVALQPAERREGNEIVRPADSAMDWGNRMRGGKWGARTLVIGLLLWADNMESLRDGTSVLDWEMAAADMAQVLRVCTEQVRARPSATQGESTNGMEGGEGERQKGSGRERTKSKALAYMEANGVVSATVKRTMGWGGPVEPSEKAGSSKKESAAGPGGQKEKRKRVSASSETQDTSDMAEKDKKGANAKRVKL
ncbi:unnamed protein product [Peniophora sp. CBMAI 1063]|nr:unnamed protein product [Peniophora sp. CBMAI 1063]